jgi:hypothetical protein
VVAVRCVCDSLQGTGQGRSTPTLCLFRRCLLPERGVGQRRIGGEGVIFVAGLRGDAVLAAELERVEPLAVAGEGFFHAGLGVNGPRLALRGQRALRV